MGIAHGRTHLSKREHIALLLIDGKMLHGGIPTEQTRCGGPSSIEFS
jgi:hypothetical protein